ncbi:MAG: heme o synthase [Balneolales bacterium]
MNINPENSGTPDKSQNLINDYLELTKPGITMLVLFSMSVGFILGSNDSFSVMLFLHTALGTLLIAAGAAAHNQYIERDLDKKMIRTGKRPLPAQKIKPFHALIFSLTLMLAGFLYLYFMVNPLTGLISAVTSILYLALYTPLKRISFINVAVGAIPGALPPVGGWVAATGSFNDSAAWILFAIVFLWQIPHIIAIAWLCEEDYRKAGFRMLPYPDHQGLISASTILTCLILLIPVSIFLYSTGVNSHFYLIGAVASGAIFLFSGLRFQMSRTKENARKVLYGSLIYLPVVWIFILADIFLEWIM